MINPKYVTQWFSKRENPVRKGVYMVNNGYSRDIEYSYWDGIIWYERGLGVREAEKFHRDNWVQYSFSGGYWRGIAK